MLVSADLKPYHTLFLLFHPNYLPCFSLLSQTSRFSDFEPNTQFCHCIQRSNPYSNREKNMSGSSERHSAYKEQGDKSSSSCVYCGNSRALLYCRADSAKLCFSCDREVHSTNQLFSKHTRTLLCDSCNDSPASILCSTESSVLCQNCDWERHKLSLSTVHERGPLEGFTGCPSVSELLTIVGLEDIGKKTLLSDEGSGGGGCGVGSDGFMGCEIEGISDLFVWDAPAVVSLDDLISSSGSSHNFQAMEVPPLPKNRKAACGRHKEEVLSQLRELAKSEPLDLEQSRNLSKDLDQDSKTDIFPSFEWHRESNELTNQVVPSDMSLGAYKEVAAKKSNCAVWETHSHNTYANNDGNPPLISLKSETLATTPKAAPCELTSQERDSALLRYKEKKKTRRYDKHIRYESRKVRAQSRTRVKGRFAKMEH